MVVVYDDDLVGDYRHCSHYYYRNCLEFDYLQLVAVKLVPRQCKSNHLSLSMLLTTCLYFRFL